MAGSLNKTMIIGNLGRDPELHYTPGGSAVAQFSVATGRSYKDANGEWQEETTWFRCVVWGNLAERVVEWARKGTKVYVEGRMAERTWDDRDGVKRHTWELIGSVVQNLSPKDTRARDLADQDEYIDELSAGRREPSPETVAVVQTAYADLDDLPF